MKPFHGIAFIVSGALFLVSAVAFADRILLKNGGQLVGIVEQQDAETIALRTDAGHIVLPREMIEAIEISARGATHLQLGESFLRSGQMDKAEEEFQLALEEPESYQQASRQLEYIQAERERLRQEGIRRIAAQAQELVAEEKLDEAADLLSQAIETQYPQAESLRRQRGEIRLQQAEVSMNHFRYAQAGALLVLAHEDGASPVRLHTLLGMLDKRQGRPTTAMEEFRLARRAALDQDASTEEIDAALEETEALLAGLVLPSWQPRPQPLEEMPAAIDRAKIWGIIERAGREYRIDPLLVEALISAESNFQVNAVSSAGAQGLMQLMPGTASDMGVSDPFDPEQNIWGGTRYLALMLLEFNGNLEKALAAYNAGPHKVRIYGGVPPYQETRAFVPKVLNQYRYLRENGSTLYPTG